MSDEHPGISLWRYMLSEGVSIAYIKELVEKHILELKAFQPDSEKKEKMIKDCETFLGELNK